MLKIYKLVDPDGVLHDYSPDVAHQVEEIVAALKRDKEANLRQRLEALRLPRTGPVVDTLPIVDTPPGTALVAELWPGLQELA